MVRSVTSPEFLIGVVGTGIMGRGIVQIALTGGFRVKMYDSDVAQSERAREFVCAMIDRAADKDRMTREDADAAKGRLDTVADLAELAECDLVVEAIVENLEIKQTLFRELERHVADDAYLASNTSSLSVTQIASVCRTPQRVAGYHFFNPVPLLKVVEVVGGQLTASTTLEVLDAVASKCGHEPVRAQDSPGFLVNHAGRGFYTEAVRIVAEGIAQPNQIDDVMRECAGFRVGPFELMDTTGLDVSGVVMESIYEQFYQEQRFAPQPFIRNRMAAGLHGRKTGRGFYDYKEGKKVAPPEPDPPTALPERVWIGPQDDDNAALLRESLASRVGIETGAEPSPDAVCIIAPLGADVTTTAIDLGLDPRRTVGVDTLFGLESRLTLMTSSFADIAVRDSAHALLAAGGNAVTVIHDSPGFIAQRMIATIVNISAEIAQKRIATPEDINKAVRLGLAYPQGPLEFGDSLGAGRILQILRTMHEFYGDPRYRPSPWLVRRARAGVSLMTPET